MPGWLRKLGGECVAGCSCSTFWCREMVVAAPPIGVMLDSKEYPPGRHSWRPAGSVFLLCTAYHPQGGVLEDRGVDSRHSKHTPRQTQYRLRRDPRQHCHYHISHTPSRHTLLAHSTFRSSLFTTRPTRDVSFPPLTVPAPFVPSSPGQSGRA